MMIQHEAQLVKGTAAIHFSPKLKRSEENNKFQENTRPNISHNVVEKDNALNSKFKTLPSPSSDTDDEMRVIGDGFSVHVDLYKRLYAYQREGILWMWSLHRRGKGGILADDMG